MTGRSEQGSAATWAVLLLTVVTIVAIAFAGAAAAVVGVRRAQAAADLAALAAAAGVVGAHGCARAAEVASRNGTRLETCSVTPAGDARVVVAVEVHGPWPDAVVIRGRARAGTLR